MIGSCVSSPDRKSIPNLRNRIGASLAIEVLQPIGWHFAHIMSKLYHGEVMKSSMFFYWHLSTPRQTGNCINLMCWSLLSHEYRTSQIIRSECLPIAWLARYISQIPPILLLLVGDQVVWVLVCHEYSSANSDTYPIEFDTRTWRLY